MSNFSISLAGCVKVLILSTTAFEQQTLYYLLEELYRCISYIYLKFQIYPLLKVSTEI